ncbi:MAG TPA: VOC family protein [Pirellulales bacterium]|jgi:catechol 2,3-dioxygenase-like lactoylglutathione lyase family enzyme|nr:VOC family protein [Pirellulales bacterium]
MVSNARALRRIVLATLAFVACGACTARAELQAAFHHVHLTATDPPAAAKWYAENLGGQARKIGFFSAVGFDKTTIIFFQAKPGFPGSVGSVADHIGFSFPDIEAKLKQLADNKVEIVSGVEQEGPIKYAFVKDPWGTLIEVVQDPEVEGLHHVHLAVTNPQETLAWYQGALGGESGRFAGLIPGIRYGKTWLLVKKVEAPLAATKGRSIDHLGWSFADLDAAAVELKARTVHFEAEPFVFGTSKIAFIVDPWGTRIELVDRKPTQPKKTAKAE